MAWKTVEIEYDRVLRDTETAICFEIEGRSVWLPSSQVTEHDKRAKSFEIPEWLAEEKALV